MIRGERKGEINHTKVEGRRRPFRSKRVDIRGLLLPYAQQRFHFESETSTPRTQLLLVPEKEWNMSKEKRICVEEDLEEFRWRFDVCHPNTGSHNLV
jgi:hypothetical protein